MHHPRILIVDDDPAIIRFVSANLRTEGYQTLAAENGAEALETIQRELPDLVILDIMMPEVDGMEVCRRVREWTQLPIIMLSARGDVQDKARCLDLGADDYIAKPFGVEELLARVRAVLRRVHSVGATPAQPVIQQDGLEIDFAQRRVIARGAEIKLTPTEFRLLQELAVNAGKVLTHIQLLNRVWGLEYREERDYLHVFIRRLRSKIEPHPAQPGYILTVPGVGYQFKS